MTGLDTFGKSGGIEDNQIVILLTVAQKVKNIGAVGLMGNLTEIIQGDIFFGKIDRTVGTINGID